MAVFQPMRQLPWHVANLIRRDRCGPEWAQKSDLDLLKLHPQKRTNLGPQDDNLGAKLSVGVRDRRTEPGASRIGCVRVVS